MVAVPGVAGTAVAVAAVAPVAPVELRRRVLAGILRVFSAKKVEEFSTSLDCPKYLNIVG